MQLARKTNHTHFAMSVCSYPPGGLSQCPCLSRAEVSALMAGVTEATIAGSTFTAFSEGAIYPSTYGAGCGIHDYGLPPYCTTLRCADDEDGCIKRWCAEPWCYVDLATCDLTKHETKYFEAQAGGRSHQQFLGD